MIGREVIRLNSVGSTMDEVARLAALGTAEGIVVVAEEQTAGRGRGGRSWHAAPGSSLLMSVLLRPEVPVERLSTLSLVAGIAVAEAIETFGLSPKLKWPNDVWLDGRKVAGILANTRVGPAGLTAILGIGINIDADGSAMPPGAISITAARGEAVQRNDLYQAVIARLNATYRAYCDTKGRPPLAGWTQRAALLGEHVQVSDGPVVHDGELLGIDCDGALLLRLASGEIIRIVAGDVTRGPRSSRPID